MKKEGLIFLFSCCFVVLSLLLILSLVVADSITGEVITGETITGEAILGNSNVSINVVASINITVDSPKNITYEFNSADEIAIELNVSADSTPDVWWFTLTNLEVEPYVVLNDSVIFTPNITIHPGVGSHSVVVYANSSFNVTFSETVLFYTQITNSAPEIQGVDDEIFVCENTALLYYFNITDVDGGDITADISPKNPFFISPTSYSGSVTRKITLYSPVLSKSDVRGRTNGTYEEEISATDGSSSDVKMTNITIIEVNNEPVVENIVTRTIWTVSDNRTFYEIVDVNDEEDGNQNSGNLSFNLTFLNGVEPFFNISNFGVMNFTANETYLGPDNSSRVYNFSLCVIDRALESP
ncbi:MAG: hypothetical protein KKD94_01600, partial [Nanoarchaeota archaeon]|nr:hypothetical protein [Nanoarchaeota archaeon]